ncbi:pilus assembly protein TadG-related protein [Micromonospora tulbaghiae]|uniref:pilus assembly protein TadG-related protein n=1 Tax=Micromonospora tulbaghiae TaxID=479978 RepID=UPI0033AAB09D
MTGRREAENGRVSLFLAVAMTGVLAIIGLAYDGAGQLRTLQRADNLAAEAARAGGQMIDRARAIEGGPKRIDQVAARAAVAAYLDAAGGVQDHEVDFPVVGTETQIRVRVQITYSRDLLSLFGVQETATVTGEATARALTGPP